MSYRSGMPLILHTADLHIGDSRNLPGYLERQEKMLAQITELAIDREVDLVVLSGDIFDAKYMKPREKDMFLRWLLDHDKAGRKHDFETVIENGNHDMIEEGYTHLRQHKIMADYGMLKSISIVEAEPRLLGPFKGTIWVAALPAGQYKGEEINFAIASLRKRLDSKLESTKQTSMPGTEQPVYFVAMVHEAILGATNELGTWMVKKGPTLDPELDVTYWALGDIHKPFQRVMDNAWYPGSPIQHDFGDTSVDRGVFIVDLENPTEPEPVLVKGITPLITLSAVPNEWPTDAIIRFEGSPDEIADTTFPDNVVGFNPVVEAVDGAIEVVELEGHDLLSDLPEVLIDQEVPADYHEDVLNEIKETMAAL
jgi:exonuclease SbcD